MTDQSNMPLSGKRSLFERAEDVFGEGKFSPAPVPVELDAPSRRRVTKSVRKAVIVEETVEQADHHDTPVVIEPAQPSAETPAAAPVAVPTIAVTRIEFTGLRLTIDRAKLRVQGLIQPEGAVTTLLEEFRLVKRQILQAARGSGNGQRVLVCSPLPGEGKTFCAVNLALAIAAEKDSEVVLVDADFGKPSVPKVLGVSAGPGLMDALADPTIRVEELVSPTDVAGLYLLPAGNPTQHDSEFLASARTAEVLARLTQGAPNRVVIFDSPPALAASPATELAGHVGQALVICRADQTGQSALEDALSLLSACPDIKLLLNAANFSPSGRRFGTYYGHGG
jgi:exopolysaccharide/PEP-CTERM locus tyrosine autokinase